MTVSVIVLDLNRNSTDMRRKSKQSGEAVKGVANLTCENAKAR